MIEGDLKNINVIISKKTHRNLTAEQRQKIAKRLKQQRKEKDN